MAFVTIKAFEPPLRIAPAGIWFEAGVEGFALRDHGETGPVYDPTFHDIHYTWRIVTDPWAFEAPGNMVPSWNDGRRAYGKKVALFFPKAGRFVVEVIARDTEGTEARAEYVVQIEDAGGHFPQTATIAVSFAPGETWDGAPEGAVKVTSPRELDAAITKSGQPTRILFRRGQSFVLPALTLGRAPIYHLDAWGTGTDPHLTPLRDKPRAIFTIGSRSKVIQLTVAHLDFQGFWDTTTETGISLAPMTWGRAETAGHYTLWGCRFAGFGMVDLRVGKAIPSTVLVGNTTITDWRVQGIFFRGVEARLALSGLEVAQHVNALHGGRIDRMFSNRGGPVRISDCGSAYIGTSDFFSRTGWSGLAGELADQPCLRLNTKGVRGSSFNVDRVVCEGGYQVINMAGSNTRVKEDPGNHLIDKALLIATAKTIGPFVANAFGGATFRNVIGILPDVSKRHSNRWKNNVNLRVDNPQPWNAETPVAIYNSSFLDLRKDDPERWRPNNPETPFENLTVENNALDQFDLATAIPGVTLRYRGIRYGFKAVRGQLDQAIPTGGFLAIPYSRVTQDTPDQKDTPPTDQAYWRAHATTDVKHALLLAGKEYRAELGRMSVSFDAEAVVIRNTSRTAWAAGEKFLLKLDRTSHLPQMDTRFASPERVPMPFPDQDRPAAGFVAFDDFLGAERGQSPGTGALASRASYKL